MPMIVNEGNCLGSWLPRMVVSEVLSICIYCMVLVWAPSPCLSPKLSLGSLSSFVSVILSFNATLSFDEKEEVKSSQHQLLN